MLSSTPTIMVVEDEIIIGMHINETLINLGYQVTDLILSGEEAITKAAELKPDLILMDIILDGSINGTQAAKAIRESLDIPVVYLTAHTDKLTLNLAKETAPFGYVVKPFTDRELYTAIEMALTRYQAEAEVRKALAVEKELNQLKSRFISMVSHEFRTPLFTILLSAGLLEKYRFQWTEDKKLSHIQRIQEAVTHMNGLLEDVLVIGQVEAGKIKINPTPIDLKHFCEIVVEEIQLTADNEQQIILVYPEDLTDKTLQGDEKILRHILGNLLSNAIKYSFPKGVIRLEIVWESERVVFYVKDEGMGIPLEDQSRIFEPFHRGSNVSTISGTGLGLSIVKKFLDLHGGKIAMKSELGLGTEFTITLPLTQNESDPLK